jgi:adenylate cyclase
MTKFLKYVPLLFALVVAGCLAAYTYLETALNWNDSPLLSVERKLLDLKFQWRGRIDIDPAVVIAAGDEKTIAAFGRWGTWDRERYALIIKNLIAAGAEVVAFDMVFADPVGIDHDHTKKIGTLLDTAKLSDTVGAMAVATSEGTPPGPPDLAQVAISAKNIEDQFALATDGDALLAAAYEEHSTQVVQGAVINTEPEDGKSREAADYVKEIEALDTFLLREYGYSWSSKERDAAAKAAGSEATIATLDVHAGGKASDLDAIIQVKGELVLPKPEFIAAASNIGFFSAYVDPDGVLRRLPLVYRIGDVFLPALSVSTAAAHFGGNPLLFAESLFKRGLATVGFPREDGSVVEVPVDVNGRLLINYYGPSGANDPTLPDDKRGAFSRVSLADVFCAGEREHTDCPAERTVDIAALKKIVDKKVVLVAVAAIGTFDQRVTPFSPNVPGTEVHAAAIQNMIDGKALKRPVLYIQIEMVLILAIGLLFGLVLPRVPVAGGVVFLVAGLGLWWAIDWNALFPKNAWFYDAPIFVQMLTTWSGVTVWGYLTTGREKAALKREFSTVLSPTVVDQLLSNPALAGLGGSERELTVMFSDIRGFTTMSEKLSPEGLTQFLNEYLTPMTEILIEHEGTLDKYMGDAIMCFWGAPIAQKDHAARAAVTAVEMLEKLEELKAKWHAEGKPTIDIGIGLNSGLMRVGFMGSERMRNYTLLGDNVNLGSRLEGTNKNYGTHIIVSEATFVQCKDVVHGRLLDGVRVKGKKEPVNIYEIIGKGPMPPDVAGFVAPFELGLKLYKQKKFEEAITQFNAAIAARQAIHGPTGDPPSEVYLERCQHFIEEAPPAEWDGVYDFKTK